MLGKEVQGREEVVGEGSAGVRGGCLSSSVSSSTVNTDESSSSADSSSSS